MGLGRGRGKIGKERTKTGFEGLGGYLFVKLIYGDLKSPLKISSRRIKIRSFDLKQYMTTMTAGVFWVYIISVLYITDIKYRFYNENIAII